MKHKIIYIEDYALIVSDEQAKENDWGYIPFQGGEVKLVGKYFADDWRKVIAHRPLTDALILKGVPLLPEFEDDDFLNTEIQVVGDNKTMSVSNFLKKYGKETYEYTLSDLRRAFTTGRDLIVEKRDKFGEWEVFTKFIDSLQQLKRPKYFECEYKPITPHKYTVDDHLEVELKTITNSGQTELVGEYTY